MSAYLKFFELEQSPFEGKAQSQVVLGTRALRDAFALIRGGLEDGDARICVSGEAGMGKTSFARALPKLLGDSARVALVLDPDVSWESLRGSIAKQWQVASGGLARAGLIESASDRRLVLVIDQAERASEEFLDHLDVILSYRSEQDEPVVQSILLARLSGSDQTEPAPIVWWLDRIHTLQLEFAPLRRDGIESYIRKHLKRAGWQGEQLFTEEAALAIHGYTGGIPGEISNLCERLLTEAAALDLRDINAAFVDSICDESVDEAEADANSQTDEIVETPEDDVDESEADAEPTTIELQEVVSESDTPAALAESLENFASDETEDAVEDEDEEHDDRFEHDSLSAPASPEELRAITGGALGRHGRAFAAAAIAAVIGGLAFVWLTADSAPTRSAAGDRREIAGLERTVPPTPSDSATEGEASSPILARLRGPVSVLDEPSDFAESAPEALDAEPEGFEFSEDPAEEDLLDGDFADMRPAAMIPDSSGKSPFEKRLQ